MNAKIEPNSMANNKETVLNSKNYINQNGCNANIKKNQDKKLFTEKSVALIFVINASTGLFGNGSFVGWTSYAMDYLDEHSCYVDDRLVYSRFTANEKSGIFAAIALAAALAPLIIHRIWHLVGSKRFILSAYFLMIVSWSLIMFNNCNYWHFMLGRGIGGLAIGMLHFLIPLYINDIAPVHQKSLFHSIMQFQFVLGILSQYILSAFIESFMILNLMPTIVSIVLFITFSFMPESPRFLASRGDTNTANEILIRLEREDRDVPNDLQLWTMSTHHNNLSTFKEEFGIAFAIPVFGLYIFEQLIGAMPILFYLRKIFKLAVVEEFQPEATTTAILCVTVFAVSILMPKFTFGKNAGIKVSLMWSTNLMAAILGILGLYCHVQGSFGPHYFVDYHHFPLICLALYYVLFATGPHRYSNEYAEKFIPKKCYFTMRCMLTFTSWLLVYVITRMLPQLIDHIGVGWLFWFMAVMCVLMSVFVKLFVDDLNKVPEESRLVDNSSESNSEA